MKKIFNTDALLAAFTGTKDRKPGRPFHAPQSLLAQSMLRSRRPELLSTAQPSYYSVTACIH